MSHGFESSKDGDKWIVLSPRFYEQGFASLRFNYRGCGEGDDKSEGDFEDTTLTERIKDYRAALDYLETTKVDQNRLGMIGSSFGGMIPLAARDTRIKAMVILATPSRFPPLTEEQNKTLGETGYFEFESGRKVKPEFFNDFQQYNICEDVRQINCPILIIHGSQDELVPLQNAVEIYENANEPKRLEMMEGGNHVLSESEHLGRIVNLSLEWFKIYL
jgi:alpha/beta superfamily hydrolase